MLILVYDIDRFMVISQKKKANFDIKLSVNILFYPFFLATDQRLL